MLRVGVTGGIGSGKSTLCRRLAERGAFVIYADDLAKQIMTSNEDLRRGIIDTFGEESYLTDGSLNRAWLAEQAFAKGRVAELDALVHPAVFAASDRLMDEAEKNGYPLAVREAAVMLQYGRPANLDKVVLVLAPETQRIARVQERDAASVTAVTDRIQRQPDYETYAPLADFVIYNDGDLHELNKVADQLFDALI